LSLLLLYRPRVKVRVTVTGGGAWFPLTDRQVREHRQRHEYHPPPPEKKRVPTKPVVEAPVELVVSDEEDALLLVMFGLL
jgi:hypothetical protein